MQNFHTFVIDNKMSGTPQDTEYAIRILEKTLQVNNSAILFTDPQGRITYVNPAFEKRTGYRREDIIGRKPNFLKSGTQPEEVYKRLWKRILAGKTWSGHLQNRCKDGSLIWENATIFPILDDHGEISQFVAIKEDISAQKRTETILRCVGEANQLLVRSLNIEQSIRMILEKLGTACEVQRACLLRYEEPISNPDKGGFQIEAEWNSEPISEAQGKAPPGSGQSLLKVGFEKWVGRLKANEPALLSAEDLTPDDRVVMDEHGVHSFLLIPVHKGKFLRGVFGFFVRSEGRVWPETEISLLSSVAANLGIVLQRKDYQADIQEALLKAESSAMEAIQANTAKNAFLATISHEIRTPLNGVLGMTQLLLDEETSLEKREFLQIISQSGNSLRKLIDDLLDFSKIEAGRLEIVRRNFSFHNLAQEIYRLFSQTAQEKNLDLLLEIDPAVPKQIHGDADRIRQILSNLLSNAIKFTKQGSVRIHAGMSSDQEQTLQISIEDTGIGIKESDREGIFEVFTQADSSSTRRFGGTGLGLTICQRLVNAMGGRIWFESVPSEGTRFYVEIPCATESDPDETGHSVSKSESFDTSYHDYRNLPPDSLRILVVEDNPVNQRVTELQLKSMGYHCELADNGTSALARFEKGENFDIVFMDCQMPGMNGFEATERILKVAHPPPAVIALTASASDYDKDKGNKVGMKDYLVKPVSKERIQKTIQELDTLKNSSLLR